MAKQRYINTRFWNDGYVAELDPIEKLLFIYFLTNEHTNICGIYELPLKIIGIETGIDETMLKKILPRLRTKIRYINGKVIIKNFIRHQLGIGDKISDNVIKGIINNLKDLDLEWLKNALNKGFYELPQNILDTLGIPLIDRSKYSNSNSNSNLKAAEIPSAKGKFNPLGSEIIKAFEVVDSKNKTYYANKTQRSACDFLLSEFNLETILDRIKVLPQTNKLPYFPKINSPYDLKEKWVKLEDQMKSKKVEYEQTVNKNKIAF